MKLRPALFLMNTAGSLVPSAGAGNGGNPPPAASTTTTTKDDDDDKDKDDKPSKKLAAEWKGRSYEAIANHHQSLIAANKHDEAAAFHSAVVKTFKDKK